MEQRTVKIAAIGLAVVLIGTLAVLPKLPPSAQVAAQEMRANPRLAEALAKIENGATPMEGILMLRTLAEEEPDNLEAQLYLAKFSVQSGQFDKAIERFKRVTEIDPSRSEVWFEMSGLHLSQRQFEDALKCAREALKHDQELHNALFIEASALEQLGDTVQALVVYEEFRPLTRDDQIREMTDAAIKRLSN